MRQISSDSTSLTETSSTAQRRVSTFVSALSAVAICFMLGLMAAPASAQNIQYTSNAADLGLRSELRINPSTQGLELQIPLAAYPGRAGVGLPVTLHYSSKLWRVKFEFVHPTERYTGLLARYSENSSAGWTSTLGVPSVNEVGKIEYYDNNGVPTTNLAVGNCNFIDRAIIKMPDGSSHELRSGDDPIPYTGPNQPLPDELHAVDGSRVRYKRSTGELFLPDGSRYVILSGFGIHYIDRNGNKLTYTSAGWTDTLGRTLPPPPLDNERGEYDYSLPGMGGVPVTYTFVRRNLSDAGVLSPGQQISYLTDKNCQNITGSPYLFEVGTSTNVCFAQQGIHNPVVLYQIVLPNGQTYTFNYNAYGEIDKVSYPTGGYERYSHQMVDWLSWLGDPYQRGNRGVTQRYISASGSAADEVLWQYPGLGIIVAPDGTRTERLMYREQSGAASFGYRVNAARVGMPYDERVYSAAGVMLRRKLTEWVVSGPTGSNPYASRNPREVKEVEIMLDTGGDALAAATTYEYDADLNVTATRRYGYVPMDQATAQNAPISSFTPQGLLRTDETTYLVNDLNIDATARAAYRARYMLSLPTSTRVKDGAGNIVAKTAISYDEFGATDYPLLTYPSTPVIPNWTDPQTNIRGLATTTSAWLNTTNSWVSTHVQYDQCGSPNKTWDANGNVSQVTYSGTYKHAYVTSTTSPDPDGTGPLTPLTTSMSYDLMTGNITSQTDANGLVTTMGYAATDALGNPNPLRRMTKVNRPGGGWTAYGYSDQPGNLSVITRTALDDSRYTESRKQFDGLGRLWRSALVEGATSIYTDKQYDLMGRLWKVSNPYRMGQAAVWRTTDYDALGRVLTIKSQENAQQVYSQITTSYSGNLVLVKDQAGNGRLSQTDALGRLKEVWEITSADDATELLTFPGHPEVTAGYRTLYAYDTLGNLTTVTQRKGANGTTQTRSFVYDSLSRLTSLTNPESGTVQYKYDVTGNLVLKIDPRSGGTSLPNCSIPYSGTNIATCYEYDSLGRMTLSDYNDTITPDVTYAYDTLPNGKGRLTSISSSASTTSYMGYDEMGRVTGSSQTTNGQTYTFPAYIYNLAGNLVSQTYPSGRVVTYTYDGVGRLNQVSGEKTGEADKTYASSFSYAAHGAVSDLKLGNNLWEHTNFNYRLQPTEIGLGTAQDSNNRLKLNYSYGTTANNGNVLSHTITVPTITWPDTGTVPGFTAMQSYTYDDFNRLKEAKEMNGGSESWKQTFTYDRFGNRNFDVANTTPGMVGSTLTINPANNRYNSGQGQILYDAAGNLKKDFGGVTFGYDAENRQVSYDGGATVAGGASYSYDGDGRRVKKVTGGISPQTTIFVYNAMGQLVAEYGAPAGGGGTSYLTQDLLGSTRLVTGDDGKPKSRHDYLPFGEEISVNTGGRTDQQKYLFGTGLPENLRQKFTQKERDTESGLDYFESRYYSSLAGRFTSPDEPLAGQDPEDPQTWNLYAYTSNNPLNRIDPDGHRWFYRMVDGRFEVEWVNPNEDGSYTPPEGDGWRMFIPTPDNPYLNIYINHGTQVVRLGENPDGSPLVRDPLWTGKVEPLDNEIIFMIVMGKVVGATTTKIAQIANAAWLKFLFNRAMKEIDEEFAQSLTKLSVKEITNNYIGPRQTELLRQLFGKKFGSRGADNARRALEALRSGSAGTPQGLSRMALVAYRELASRAVRAGIDKQGTQAIRIKIIDEVLKRLD